jgi:outer membrane protein assembly factor BamB
MPRGKHAGESTLERPLRLWPGVVAAVLLVLVRFVLPLVAPGAALFAVIGGVACGLAIVAWWAFFSRAPRSERWGAVVLMIVALAATQRVLHESIATAGMGMMFFLYAVPLLGVVFVLWAAAGRGLADGPRRATLVATILLASGVWTIARSNGITGDGALDLTWRWTETAEERLLAQGDNEPVVLQKGRAEGRAETGADWPGFRGPDRDSVIRGVRIATDWSSSPPVALWRRPIGPGISSFAVGGDVLYTQEQRGDDEIVAAYDVTTGEPLWRHRDAVRFWDSHAGAGPRGTPTLSNGHIYTLGGTGIVNALQAGNGALVWSRDAASDAKVTRPGWGFAGSPLVVDDVVVVAVAGTLVAYDLASGHPRWFGPEPAAVESYSSPHLLTIDGVEQVLLMGPAGATSVAPADGTILWEHQWPGAPIVQPSQTADGDVLLTTAGASGALGLRRLAVSHGHGGWTLEELWTSDRLKPYFNDFVVHDGHAYGFDGSILACIELEGDERRWKGGRYGNGQLVLLADQDLLLLLSEEGELVLVDASPDQFTEIARFPAIDGRTWNHPALVGDVVLIRNDREMAAFRLPLAGE